MSRSPLLGVLLVLLAFAVAGNSECRESAACQVSAVTHNEVLQ